MTLATPLHILSMQRWARDTGRRTMAEPNVARPCVDAAPTIRATTPMCCVGKSTRALIDNANKSAHGWGDASARTPRECGQRNG